MSLATGTKLGPYEITAPLGAGGMGEVYRARDTKLGREVAIKILPASFASDPDRLMRFEREAKTLASLNHPHIAQIYGFEQSDTTSALVMELVDGEDLAERLKRGPLPFDEALPIARQIAEALEAAHDAGIIHRDLKPANIKVRPDGTVKVLDFGLAKAGDAVAGAMGATITSPAMTMQGMILGTAAYMAPEQAKGKPVDKRADIWAFGCVLYEMLTGTRAFDGEDVSETIAAILRGEPDWAKLPPLPPAVSTLVKRCLERDWRRRVGDMSAARFILDDPASFSTAPLSPGVTPVDVQGRIDTAVAQTRRRLLTRSIVAALILLAVAATIAVLTLPRLAVREPARVMRFAVPIPQGQVLGLRQMTALSPDGQGLAYVSHNQLVLRRFSQFDEVTLASGNLSWSVSSPSFSPDGTSLAFYSTGESALKRVSTHGGVALRVCDVALPLSVSWEASGILLGMGSDGVLQCNPAGGAPQQLVRAAEGETLVGPQLLPGGDALLFTTASLAAAAPPRWDSAQIVVQSLKSGKRHTVVTNASGGQFVPPGTLFYTTGGMLFAAPFDPATQQLQGEPVPLIDRIRRLGVGPPLLAISATALVYMPAPTGGNTNERDLVIGDRSGIVSRTSATAGPFVHVRASRDGRRVAIGSDDGKDAIVWIYALDGTSAMQRLTLDGRNRFPIWSPDGQWVAYQSDRDGGAGIYRQRADGVGGVQRLTTAAEGESHIPESWSPDGRTLSYAVGTIRGRAAQYSLWMLSLSDRKAAPFAGVTSIEPIGSVFSPDGKWIAYSASPGDDIGASNRGVFVQPFPANGSVFQAPRQLVDFHPMWAPDGRELIFLASTTARQMAAVRVSGTGSLTFGAPARFPTGMTGDRLSNAPRSFDILPDGRFIGVVSRAEAGARDAYAELRVVLNWAEELKIKTPRK